MKVLVVLHGMPPQAGRTVVGSGLRAFSNGEALRGRGHQVLYCTRTEDLPDDVREQAAARRSKKPLLLTTITGEIHPPGDPRRVRRRLTAVGPAPTADEPDAPRPSLEFREVEKADTHPGVMPGVGAEHRDGLAPVGGSLGSPGNPFAFTEGHELHEIVQRVDPDVVLVEALEEARRLPDGRFSVILDLFAPRILEQQFQVDGDEREAVRVLDAIQRGDSFLFSNERQKYFHLPLLAMAGVDCTRDAGAVVPISCPPDFPTAKAPPEPVFIAGGVFWPWADLSNGLASLLSVLDARDEGHLHLYGGEYAIRSDTSRYADPRRALPKEHPRLHFKGMVPIDQLWSEYSRGSVAFDLMTPNPEREINLSFRQVDYLRCGLPLITSPRQVIAADVLEYGAGWVVEPGNTRALRRLIDELLDEPNRIARASTQAQALARDRYAWDATAEPLDALVRHPVRRKREETFVAKLTRTQGDLWEEHEENQRLREAIGHQRRDLDKKTEEIGGLNQRIGTLMGSVDRLSESLGAVSTFKNDAVKYLQEQHGEALKDVGSTALELERKALDLQKKQDALAKAQKEIAKLKGSIGELRTDNEHLEARFVARDREALGLEEGRQRAVQESKAAQDRLEALRQDLAKKEAERDDLAAMHREEVDDLRERLEGALGADARASADADALRGEAEELRVELAAARADATKKARELQRSKEAATRQHAAQQRALDALQTEAIERLEAAEEAAARVAQQLQDRLNRSEEAQARLKGRLAQAEHRAHDLEGDVAKKLTALAEGARERQRLEATFLRSLDAAESAARDVLERARDRIATLEDERGAALARIDELGQQVRDARRDVRVKEQAIQRAATERERAQGEFLAQLDRAEEAADQRLQEARETAQQQVTESRSAAEGARRERDLALGRLETAQGRVTDLEGDVAKKDLALAAAGAERDRLAAEFVAALDRAEEGATALLQRARDAAAKLQTERTALRAGLDEARGRVAELQREQLAAERELERQRSASEQALARGEADALRAEAAAERRLQEVRDAAALRLGEARAAAEESRAERDLLHGKLEQATGRLADLEGDLTKKDQALAAAEEERDRLQASFLTTLGRAETGATELLERARDAAARLGAERSALKASLDEARGRLRELEREAQAAAREQERRSHASDEALARAEAEALRAQEAADRRLQEAREAALLQVSEARRAADEATRNRDLLQGKLEKAEGRLTDVEGDLAKKDQVLKLAVAERDRVQAELSADLDRIRQEGEARLEDTRDQVGLQITEARKAADAARRERDALRTRLDRAQGRLGDLEADVAKKDAAMAALERQRDQLQAQFLQALEAAEDRATVVAEELRNRLNSLALDRSTLHAQLRDTTQRLRETERTLQAREAELQELERAATEAEAQWDEERSKVQEEAERRIRDAHDALVSARQQRDGSRDELLRVSTLAEDLQGDVAKKTAALAAAQLERERLQEEFLGSLERARGGAQQVLTDAQERVHRLTDQRVRLQAFVEQLQVEAARLGRDVEAKDTALSTAQDRLQDEREQYQHALLELEELRSRSQTNNSRVVEAEASLQRQQSALESLSGELARITGQLEEAQFEADAANSQLAKKDREIREAQQQRDEAWTTVDTAQAEIATLRAVAEKKTAELDAAMAQRDEVTQEKFALQTALDDALATIRQLSGGQAKSPAPKKKKAPKERRAKPRNTDAPDTSAN